MQTINEGSLHLRSAGGAVKMGSIKARDISVATAGVQPRVPSCDLPLSCQLSCSAAHSLQQCRPRSLST